MEEKPLRKEVVFQERVDEFKVGRKRDIEQSETGKDGERHRT
jgi:hypothetical protein